MSDIFEKLLILRTQGIGPAKYNALVQKFGTPADVVAALNPTDELRDMVSTEMSRAESLHIYYISDTDDLYPSDLRKAKNPPPVITVRGNLELLRRDMVSIVGTRHATAAGMELVADIAHEFATHNTVVVSGMAIGTDTAAHRGALRATNGAGTIAVLAGGADYIWPLENESLYWDIVSRGAVISEMPVGFTPIATNFVQRNRIVAGLSSRLILGEADLKSGSMTTARFAHELNREIWAIPSHPSDLRAFGPNSLIRDGVAKLCMGVSDFFDASKKEKNMKKNSKKIDSENSLIDAIGTIPVSESVLAEIVKKSIVEIKSELVVLELSGFVRRVDGGYIRV